MTGRQKKILKSALSLAGAAVLLYFAFRGVEWSEFAATLGQCHWGFVLLSMACGVSAFFFRAVRWRQMLMPLDPETSLKTTYHAVTIGNISNFIFQYLGEFVRCVLVCRHSGCSGKKIRYDQAIGTIALERVLDLFSIVVLFSVLLVCRWNRFGDFFSDKVLGPLSGISGNTLMWVVAALSVILISSLCVAVLKFRNSNALFSKAYDIMKGLADGFMSFMKMRKKVFFLVSTALIWVMYWLQIVFMSSAVPSFPPFGPADALFIMLAGSIASFVPVPGGFGAYHYLVALSLSSLYGISWASGIFFATLAHESQALTMVVTGGISYFAEISQKNRNTDSE